MLMGSLKNNDVYCLGDVYELASQHVFKLGHISSFETQKRGISKEYFLSLQHNLKKKKMV